VAVQPLEIEAKASENQLGMADEDTTMAEGQSDINSISHQIDNI
jgi:hypothetical protein